MAAEDKLQNIKAIKQMIAGTHKSQTKKTHGFSDAKDMAKKMKDMKLEMYGLKQIKKLGPNGKLLNMTDSDLDNQQIALEK